MAFWKQFVLSIVVIVAGFAGWIFFAPGAADSLKNAGVPESLVSRIAPPSETADATAPAGDGQARGEGGNRRNGGGRGGNNAVLIATQDVQQGVVNDRLSAIGTGDAIRSVAVTPQATGTIREILIKSGDKVKAGQVIAKLDSEEQVIAKGQAEVSLKAALEKSSLYHNIKSSVSRMDVFDAEIAEQGARLQLQAADLNLSRRDITAPIDGIVGIVPVNIGDNVTTTSTIVQIDDRSQLLVDFWAPERFAVQVSVGMPVEATSASRPGRVFEGSVEAIDNRVDPASRTIRIRAKIENQEDMLLAGMSFGVTMRFPGETYASVSPLAVQWDSKGSFVWQIVDKKSVKSRVRIIQRNPDAVLVSGDVKAGDVVATEGLQRVRENGAVRMAGEKLAEVAG